MSQQRIMYPKILTVFQALLADLHAIALRLCICVHKEKNGDLCAVTWYSFFLFWILEVETSRLNPIKIPCHFGWILDGAAKDNLFSYAEEVTGLEKVLHMSFISKNNNKGWYFGYLNAYCYLSSHCLIL